MALGDPVLCGRKLSVALALIPLTEVRTECMNQLNIKSEIIKIMEIPLALEMGQTSYRKPQKYKPPGKK